MDRGGLSNSGEITTIRLDRSDYSTDEDICGTVELSNMQRKEITSVTLEFSTWRHISTTNSKKTSVEQLSRQHLELFPNLAAEGRRYGQDDRVLKTNVMFSFTFSGTKRHATVDFLENARIKNYITCYVHRKSGLLSRDRLMEKNQFQVPIRPATLEVDALFPDRLFDCLVSRPLSTNSSYYDFRARCNTHLMPGLPFLVEVDTAVEAEISSIALSLHQAVYTSVGTEEDDHGLISRYVHEVERPAWALEGHFRGRDSARRLTHGRRSWLVEWVCPKIQSRSKLPFEPTFYCKTQEGNMERGLSLKVEVELRNAPSKLVAMMHGLQYCPDWKDSRPDQSISLRVERSVMASASPPASIRSVARQEYTGNRRASVISDRSGTSFSFSQQQQQFLAQQSARGTPLLSPGLSVRSQDYFGDGTLATRNRITNTAIEPKLTHGSNSPQSVHLFSRSDSVRSTAGSGRATQGPMPFASRHGSMKPKPEKLTLPPASVRSSISSAFENMHTRRSPANSSLNSPTRRDFDDLGSRLHHVPTPPPTQPLPPAPTNETTSAYQSSGMSSSMSGMTLNEDSLKSRQKKPTRLSRPAVILGVSQDTIQTLEDAGRALAQEQSVAEDFGPNSSTNGAYSASIKRAVDQNEGQTVSHANTDRDSGFSETSFVPGSPLVGRPPVLATPIQSMGFARRAVQRTATDQSIQNHGGTVMLG
ncbi:protein of unknown function [Taphrina deformans PYCC 5710]|uniref:Uncharacterized protein n=1 Tax=Taphrina deformans (strain PYCC 5710 / ATCC 11124 / CBS 356.35 / IMI 108563 / JCM 9778 / NBRC 8474) TaxID=1097556 RepID=R4XC28_TAPDE|nr:protein of unknown function [Taphrina deformans PYCC 5710]|eukprot:CCG80895.1 protein of unknown function [Taphrina deformans PYCC 5710]